MAAGQGCTKLKKNLEDDMRKIISVVISAVFLVWNFDAFAAIQPVGAKRHWRAQLYIANQIKGIGLVDSYKEDGTIRSYVYDNALAAMACMAMGNFGLAEELLDTLCVEVVRSPEGVFLQYYGYSDTAGGGGGAVYCGNTAWLLQALNTYQKLKSSNRYLDTQKQLADFLLTLQDPTDGGLRGTVFDCWKSAEHNIIAYVALTNFGRLNNLSRYTNKARKIKNFLLSQSIWNGTRFNRGPNDPARVIDAQSLGVLLFGGDYASALKWAQRNLQVSRTFGTKTVTGFDFDDNLDTIWTEGTLQMALAFYRAGDLSKADYYYKEALKLVQNDGSELLATNIGTAGPDWTLEVWRAIAPTSWLIFFCLEFNPLVLYE
jgi:tetratricopeptide (TPR) repeat protein